MPSFTPRLWERVDLIFAEGSEIECAVRWLREDRVGLEFAHETRIDCEPELRDKLLLDVIRRSFGDEVSISTAKPEPASARRTAASADEDEVANSRRTERRHPLVWMGHVFYNHGSEKVRLRNISENGALIEAPISYPLGAEIYLDLGDAGQYFATINWTFGDKIGLKFKDPFDMKVLGKSKPDVTPVDADPSRSDERQCRPGQSLGGRLEPSVDRRAARRPRGLPQALGYALGPRPSPGQAAGANPPGSYFSPWSRASSKPQSNMQHKALKYKYKTIAHGRYS